MLHCYIVTLLRSHFKCSLVPVMVVKVNTPINKANVDLSALQQLDSAIVLVPMQHSLVVAQCNMQVSAKWNSAILSIEIAFLVPICGGICSTLQSQCKARQCNCAVQLCASQCNVKHFSEWVSETAGSVLVTLLFVHHLSADHLCGPQMTLCWSRCSWCWCWCSFLCLGRPSKKIVTKLRIFCHTGVGGLNPIP